MITYLVSIIIGNASNMSQIPRLLALKNCVLRFCDMNRIDTLAWSSIYPTILTKSIILFRYRLTAARSHYYWSIFWLSELNSLFAEIFLKKSPKKQIFPNSPCSLLVPALVSTRTTMTTPSTRSFQFSPHTPMHLSQLQKSSPAAAPRRQQLPRPAALVAQLLQSHKPLERRPSNHL